MERVEVIAAACHQAVYSYSTYALHEEAYCWECAPDCEKSAIFHAIHFWDALDPLPSFETLCQVSHITWMRHKLRSGWKYGTQKDILKRIHPSLVDYEQLSEERRQKDQIIVRTYLTMRQLLPPPA